MGKRVRALKERPQLEEDVQLAWLCFTDLNREREAGFAGPQAIRLTEIAAWMDLHCLRGADVRADFYRLVVAADDAALTWIRERQEEDDERERKKKGRK
jgi:hypothetical protein